MDLSIEFPIGCETERPSTLEVTQLKCGPLLVVENNAEEDRQKQNWQQRAQDKDHQQGANFHKVWSLAVAGQCRIGNPTSERKVWVILNSSRTDIFQRIKGGNQHNCPLDHHVGLERGKLSVDGDFDFLDVLDSFLRGFVLQSTGVEKFNRYFCHLRVLREISLILL